MKLRMYKALHRIVENAAYYFSDLKERLESHIYRLTPPEPNPYPPGTLAYEFYERWDTISAELYRKTLAQPWTTLLNDPPTKWQEQMGENSPPPQHL